MEENRNQQRASTQGPEGTIWVSETLRNGAAAGADGSSEKEDKSEKISIFWRVFGGTILSILALVLVTLYNGIVSNINEVRNDIGYLNKDLRKDLTRLSESQADLVKKDEFSTRMRSVWDNMKELRNDNTTFLALKERTGTLEQALKAADEERKELIREVQRLREVKAVEAERKELVRELQQLRERLAAVEGRQPASGAPVKPAIHRDP